MPAAIVTDKRGASALEFAIVAPILLLLVMGIIEFGRLMWTREALQQSAFSGARCMGVLSANCASAGSVNTAATDSFIQSVGAGWMISIPSSAIALNPNTVCGSVAGFSQVTLTYTFSTAVPNLIRVLAPGVTLTAQACYPNQPA
jgi:Flp pilus assembly protein TadG